MTGALRRSLHPLFAFPLAAALIGCPDPLAGVKRANPQPGTSKEKANTRYMRVRTLLEQDANAPARAKELYPLVAPLCTSEKERADFVDTAKWSVSFAAEDFYLPALLAADTLEHVATSCMRNHPEGAFDLLEKAKVALPNLDRIAVLEARLRAAHGELEAAEAAARRAMAAGSVHAIALTANIQARRARAAEPGYRPGMLDPAIHTVSATPTAEWPPIDLTAILSTKARLLSERALWEPPEAAAKTRLEAAGLYQRLSGAPFIAAVRARALDVLCFEAELQGRDLYNGCARLVAETKDLGAALATGESTAEASFDAARRARLEALRDDLAKLDKGQTVAVVVRGDELELLEWARAAASLLSHIDRRHPRWVVIDRTSGPRARRLVEQILELAKVKPDLHIDADHTLAMPCITAQMAGRKVPDSCPLPAETVKALRRLRPFALSVLVGRDLDAEIDDLRLYELRTALLSYRQSRMDKGIDAWFKSLSDVGIVLQPEGFGALGGP